jgi:hypothetical protein
MPEEVRIFGLSLCCLSPGIFTDLNLIDPFIEPGALVRHPAQPDWGLGQVQTVVAAKVTVNFEHAGKQVIDTSRVALTYIGPDPRE